MFLIYVYLILISVFVAQNKNIDDNLKSGWFIFTPIFTFITLLVTI